MTDDPGHEGPPPPALERRVIATLRARGVLRPRRAIWTLPLQIAAGVVLFAAGVLAGRASPPALAPEATAQYLLALHEDASFAPGLPLAELVREYAAWAAELEGRGRLVAAEQLDAWSRVLPEDLAGEAGPDVPGGGVPQGGRPSLAALEQTSGFFLIRAGDREEALAVARTHPHLRHGGRVVVREVVR
jgi:hypothetical protein